MIDSYQVVQIQEHPAFPSLIVTPHSLCTSVLNFAPEYGTIWTGKGGSSILLYLRFLQKHPQLTDETPFQNTTLFIVAVTLLAALLKFVKLFNRSVYFFVSKKVNHWKSCILG